VPRLARLDAPGTLHHIIIRGIEKRRIVDDQRDRKNFVSRTGQLAKETGTVIYAWSLMTNHAHILLRSGNLGLPTYMQRLLTGYAISYNRRHARHGHLLQNRYKSIVCEEDAYFLELVRYIHLNPLRAKLVKTLSELDRYRWCGHSAVIGRHKTSWQDRDYVLSWFGNKQGEALRAYGQFVLKGVKQGRRPELVGGGLIRSLGGWSQVKALRRVGIREASDERILGSSDFVTRIIEEAEERLKYQFSACDRKEEIGELIQKACAKENVKVRALRSGSRQRRVSQLRLQIAKKLVNDFGISLAETARQLGVTTSSISKSLARANKT
jgi:putative transposase